GYPFLQEKTIKVTRPNRENSRTERFKKALDFVVHLFCIHHRLGHFAAKQLTIAPPQPMGRCLYGALCHAEFLTKHGIRDVLTGDMSLEALKESFLAERGVLSAQRCQHV